MSRLLSYFLLFASCCFPEASLASPTDSTLTGHLGVDLLHSSAQLDARSEWQESLVGSASSRSVPLAALLSGVVPGAGQAYNRSWGKMVIASALEVSLITAYFVWNGRGHDGEDEFRAYAHSYWSPIRYANWLSGYTGYGGPPISLPSMTEQEFMTPDTWTVEQQSEVRSFFNTIRAAEEQSYHIETGAAFSHVLPYFSEQQYYELIGKYFQFAPGWDDYNGANDPEESGPGGEKVNVPRGSRFYVYDDMHERTNNLLRKASRVSGLLIVNHFLAAIDAAITAKLHNDRLTTRVALVPDAGGGLVWASSVVLTF